MMEATPKRKNRQRELLSKQQQVQPRRYDFDSTESSSSDSGGLSSPSPGLPLHYQRSPANDSSSYESPSRSRLIRESKPGTPTPTTTIGQTRSPRSKQIHGKLSRPRRRGRQSFGNLNVSNSYSNVGLSMSDCSLNSLDSPSDHSLLSRYTATSKTTSGSGNNTGLSRRASSSNNLNNGSQQLFFSSSNSLLGLAPKSKDHHSEDYRDDEYYHKHQHHPQHYDSGFASPLSSPTSSLPPLPSLRLIASELFLICKLYGRHGMRYLRKPCRKFRKRLLQGLLSLTVIVLVLLAWLCYDFYADAVDICMPPPGARHSPSDFAAFLASTEGHVNATELGDGPPRPFVEYYVHGRGIGHYARSIAIVEQLNRAGVDVRMFLTRASLWRAMHEDSKIIVDPEQSDLPNPNDNSRPFVKRGKTTAISITSLTPDQGFFDSLSHALERISGDCEVSASSGRYPQLVISDGDFPGMIRAEIGGIPSVGIAHGQLFTIAQKPKWISESGQLSEAWDKQGRLNHVSSYFAEWQIATHFCFLESRYNSGTVARPPLRPEVLQMAEARKWARRGKMVLATSALENDNSGSRGRLPQAERIEELLHAGDPRSVPVGSTTVKTDIHHRKLVICYFRDHNGEHLVQELLDADFDVVLFETGYTRDMANNPYRYGVKWLIKDEERDEERKKYILDENQGDFDTNPLDEKNLKDAEDILQSSNDGNYQNDNTQKNTMTFEGRGFEVHRSQQGGPKLIRVMDRSLFVPLMHVADGVASSAGSQLMSECIYSHMPLLAMYKEDDSEQRLNVELSHHVNAPCHQPLVFGNSFESLTSALQSNRTSTADDLSAINPVLESFKAFVKEVHSSSVSRTYFETVRQRIASNTTDENHEHVEIEQEDSNGVVLEEVDPFRGLPDAAAIILEIVKQVVQKE